jgi:hypothetical protein
MAGKSMLATEGRQFHCETVFLTGRLFRDCLFANCTLVSHGPPIIFENCTFGPNIWRVELTFHDANDVADFSNQVVPWIYKSLDPDTFKEPSQEGDAESEE